MTKKITLLCFFMISLSCFSQKILELQEDFDFNSNELLREIDPTDPELGELKVFSKKIPLKTTIKTLIIDLPSGKILSFKRTNGFLENTIIHWQGTSANSFIEIQENEGKLSGTVKVDNETYYGISNIGDNHYVLFKKGENNSDCDTHLYSSSDTNKSDTASKVSLRSCNGLFFFRVIIAYTSGYSDSFSAINRQERINDSLERVINSVNEVYINSNLNVRARLAFSYETDDSEKDNKGANLRQFIYDGFLWPDYNEVFDYIDEYNADVAILLTDNDDGGRANRNKNMAVYGGRNAWANLGVAHEIGHMFDLDHNREEISDWQRKINGLSEPLDNKKAYGFRGDTFRSVMSVNGDGRRRVSLHSDEDLTFPDNDPAGNNRARARDYLQSHIGNVIKHNDANSISIDNKTIQNDQMASLYAYNFLETKDLIVNNSARVNLRSGFSVNLKPGTHFTAGSVINVQISDCIASVGFKSDDSEEKTKTVNNKIVTAKNNDEFNKTDVHIYPNPANNHFTISSNEVIIDYNVFNSLSTMVLNEKVHTNKLTIDVQNLPKGMYIVRVVLVSGEVIMKKIIKN